MATTIQVTPEQLENAAKSIETLASDYKTLYNEFYKETDGMATAWKGEDNQAYINQIAGFKNDFENMFKLMNDYVGFLRVSAKAYRETQGNVVREASKLTKDA